MKNQRRVESMIEIMEKLRQQVPDCEGDEMMVFAIKILKWVLKDNDPIESIEVLFKRWIADSNTTKENKELIKRYLKVMEEDNK